MVANMPHEFRVNNCLEVCLARLPCDLARCAFDESEDGVVRLRVAEVREHAIAHVLGYASAIALDEFRAAAVVGPDDRPQVLRIEPSR
jgi:hypothetical protein